MIVIGSERVLTRQGRRHKGRLKSRAWARGITTWYTNNNAGELWVVNYSDSTPDVTNSYDRRGRLTNILSGATSLTKLLNDAGNLLQESYTGGPLNGVIVTNHYDALLRRDSSGLRVSAALRFNHGYSYGDASRLLTVGDGTNSATYDYLDYSPLVGEITFATNGTTVMTTTKGYDFVNRLTNTTTLDVGLGTLDSHAYKYNPASQRTSVTNVDGSYWVYTYDTMGQVTSGRKYWGDGTAIAGQQFDYAFDDIGNRQTTTRDTRQASYSVNSLNQYTSRTVPGFVNVLGTATNTATVSLWSKDNLALYTPTTRKGDYFRGEMLFNNNTGALWLTITNVAVLSNYTGADIVTNTIGKLFVPKTAETFSHDTDGNLTNDGRWAYVWDAENRITSFTRNGAAPVGSRVKLDCAYDSKSRRTQKIVSTWNGSAYQPAATNRFVYDDWNLIAILDSNSSLLASFQWGMDASGSLQGAGGVGGLLSMTIHAGTNAGTYFYCYDGNHNVTTLVNATNGAVAAQYEYDPFLGILRATGRLAFLNPFVGSTKFCDWETGLLYYGYRYYDPETGRWLSHDPIGEKGGGNLYGFVGNNPISTIDPLGLIWQGPGGPGDFPYPPPSRPYPPKTPFPQRMLKKYDCSCCGAQEIADGKKELIDRFNQAKKYLDDKGLKPDGDADGPGEASCDTSNGAVLNFINPTPRCWICFMDRRWDNSWINRWDENFIHCYTVNNKGIKDELILDWFDSSYHDTTGVYGDVKDYYKNYPTQADQYKNTPVFADCSKPGNTWSPNYSKFDFMFDPNRKDPPVNR